MKYTLYIKMCCLLSMAACTSNLKKENEALREEIDERRENLETKIEENLEAARLQLTVTDSLLNIANREHDKLHEWVMEHATELNEHSTEVLLLNSLRAERDSLRVEFEKQAQKVKFYMSKSEK